MKIFKNIVSIILAFLLMASILLTVAVQIVSSTILNKDYILGKLEEANYYNNVYEQIKDSLAGYIGPSGLDEEVLENIYTREQVKEDINLIINNIYENKNDKINTEDIKEKLQNNIEASVGSGLLTKENKNSIEDFIDKIADEYVQNISHDPYFEKVGTIINKAKDMVGKVEGIIIFVPIILAVVILLLNIKQISSAVRFISISILTSGVIGIALKLFIETKINISNILIINDSFSEVIKNVINSILNNINTMSIIGIIGSIVLIVLTNVIKVNRQTIE